MFVQLYEEKYMRFPQGKCKALTFSYDDGVVADAKLLDIFRRYGLKGTFNLNSKRFDCPEWHSRMDEEQTYKTFSGCGQEIALHGARHAFLEKLPLCEAIKEVADNRSYLEDKYNRIVRGMAYAYSSFNDDIKRALRDLGVVYARTTAATHSFALPQDFLEWNPTCHHGDGQLQSLCDKFFSQSPLNQPKHRESWLFYVWGHAYEYDDNGNWQIIEDLGKRAAAADDVWHATNMEVYEYVTAYKNLVYSLDGERVFNPSAIPVWVELRGEVYKIEPGATVRFNF